MDRGREEESREEALLLNLEKTLKYVQLLFILSIVFWNPSRVHNRGNLMWVRLGSPYNLSSFSRSASPASQDLASRP